MDGNFGNVSAVFCFPKSRINENGGKGTSETISRILQPYNIRVAHKPTSTLGHFVSNVEDRDEPKNQAYQPLG